MSFHQRGRLREAEQLYRALLARHPNFVEAHNNLGYLLQSLNRNDEALTHYLTALRIKPDFADAMINLGNALQALNRHEEAISRYAAALKIRPNYPEAYLNFGNALQALNRAGEAVARYETAIALRPGYAEAHYHLGIALEKVDRRSEAKAHYERAIALKPDYPEAHNNLGNILRSLNRYEEAIAQFAQALAIKPDYGEAQWNEGASRLTIGDYDGGWHKHEWRRLLGIVRPRVQAPMWIGNWDLSNKTILLYAEQGLGDTIQFARYAPLLMKQGAQVVLEVQAELASLLASLPGAPVVRARGEPLPRVDCQCPLLSLPLACRTRLETIPAEVPYLFPAPDRVARWRAAIEADIRPVIGIKWRANESTGSQKSVPLPLLLPLIGDRRFKFVALEKEIFESDARLLSTLDGVTVIGDQLRDFADTAAVIAGLDLVISVDTSVAHLAGAMAKPVWVPLQFAADWRWMHDRTDNLWYPTARLLRQSAIGDWTNVVAALQDGVQALERQGPMPGMRTDA
ncbi:MAG: tetratricopeptide repeat protein [Stellaceae bacterium]